MADQEQQLLEQQMLQQQMLLQQQQQAAAGMNPAAVDLPNYKKETVEKLSSIMVLLGTQNAQTSIEKFQGDPKRFQNWVKSIEKYTMLIGGNGDQKKRFALQTADGPVSEFLVRYYSSNPVSSWPEVLAHLKARFGEIIDNQHALQVLRSTRQKPTESIQVYAERVVSVAEQAWPDSDLSDPLIQRQLIDCFIDGLTDSGVARKVMRDSPDNFQDAVRVAVNEQNLARKFELRNRGLPKFQKFPKATTKPADFRQEEPMEVDSFRGVCFKCHKKGHRAVDCRSGKTARVAAMHTVTCFKCGEAGHVISRCPNRGSPATGRCWLCGDKQHKQADCPRRADNRPKSNDVIAAIGTTENWDAEAPLNTPALS